MMQMFMEQKRDKERREDLRLLREEQKLQREEMVAIIKAVSLQQTQQTRNIEYAIQRLSPPPSKNGSDSLSDPNVIDRRYEQYVKNAFEAGGCLQEGVKGITTESDIAIADENAQINVGKLTSFVDQYIFPRETSLKKEIRLQQAQIIENDFDQAHRLARTQYSTFSLRRLP
ncbi:hypothetical protein SNE40_003370 [Patella caerulea]|uniref:Uncharacterized protein n=1 Tax=Patella caerulea TaxID=87958 RepID=A0AAN8KG90_PATCE